MPEIAVVKVERVADDGGQPGRLVHIERPEDWADCPECGVVSTRVRQRRTTRPRDLPYGPEPLAVRWYKRQFACTETLCTRKAFTESVAEIPPRARVTGRLCRAVARQVASGRSVAAVGREYEVGWPLVHRHFAVHADALLIEPEPPRVLGIDETRRGRPKWIKNEATGRWARTELFETNFVDLSGSGALLGRARRFGRHSGGGPVGERDSVPAVADDLVWAQLGPLLVAGRHALSGLRSETEGRVSVGALPPTALSLPDGCEFQLQHCGLRMEERGSDMRWTSKPGEGEQLSDHHFGCSRCPVAVSISVREPA
ncbi:transposase family protein [Streptosporangium subroseum]|uniref:transposase family protein n=1 Tax=Streptosporangium subroseum TaxID=106412 RepID=UPI00343E0A52